MKAIWALALAAIFGAMALGQTVPGAATVSIDQPDGVNDAVSEGDDFATSLNMPWDMSDPPFPNYDAVMFNFDPNSFVVQNGIWEAVTATADPQVRIHPASAFPDDPIDADHYRILSFRMYASAPGQAVIYWFPQTPGQLAWSSFIPVAQGWNTYVVDLATIPLGGVSGGATGWNGLVRALRFDPVAAAGVTIRLDWIRLTSFDGLNAFPIEWSGLATDGATLELFADMDNGGYDGVKIGEVAAASGSGSFQWGASLNYAATGRPLALPGSFEPGDYHIYALVDSQQAGYSAGPVAVAPQTKSVTLTQPDGVGDVIGEGDDFATMQLRRPWDMSAAPYPDFPSVLRQFDRGGFTVGGGQWTMQTTNNDPGVNVLTTGLLGQAQPMNPDGATIPLDADRYRLLTFRMYSDVDSVAQIFYFFDGTQTDLAVTPGFPISAGWGVYCIDLAEIGVSATQGAATGWTGMVRGLRIDPLNSDPGATVRFDWVRLTPGASPSYAIEWNGLSPVGATLELYVDTDGAGHDGVKVGEVMGAGASGVFNWGVSALPDPAMPYPPPTGFEPGEYFVYAVVNGDNQPYSPGTLTVNPAPVIDISHPSRASGEDYATAVVGDPWDMTAAPDVRREEHVIASSFTSGVHIATSDTSRDPQFFLNQTDPIDPARYRYVSFRYMLEGNRNVGNGSVSRLIWHEPNMPQNAGVTLDMLVHEGWHVYALDLTHALLSIGPQWTDGSWTTFRFDPHEFDEQRTSHVDYVTLTAIDEAAEQYDIRWELPRGVTGDTLTANLYHDDDRDFANGATLIATLPGLAPSALRQPADFDGDGPDDALLFEPGRPDRYWLEWDNGLRRTAFEQNMAALAGALPRVVDIDGDGRDELVFWEPSLAEAHWFRAVDGQTAAPPELLPAPLLEQTGFSGAIPQFSYSWNTPSGVGEYYIWVEIDDGLNTARFVSDAPVAVDNPCRALGDLLSALPLWNVDLDVRDLAAIASDLCP